MVRYIKNDELMHYRVGGEKKGVRHYQYESGSLTPEGRIHYGVGDPRKGVKVSVTKKTIADKNSTTGYDKLKSQATKIKATLSRRTAKFKKAYNEAREANEEARQKLIVAKEKQKQSDEQAKLERAEDLKKKQAEDQERINAEKVKKDEATDERIAKAKEIADAVKTDLDDRMRESDSKDSKDGADEAKTNRWKNFSDEELEKYAKRVELEAKATEAMLKKADAPRKVIEMLVNYGKSGYNAYKAYTDITKAIAVNKAIKLDPSKLMAKELLGNVMESYNNNLYGADPSKITEIKDEMYKDMQFIEATSKLFNMAYDTVQANNNGGGGNNNKKKGN